MAVPKVTTVTRMRLQLLDDGPAALEGELLDHLELAPVEVHVRPAERQDLTPSHPGDEAQVEGGVQAVFGHGHEERARFVQRPAQLAPGSVGRRRLGEHNGVAGQATPLDGLLQGHGEDLAHQPDGGRPEAGLAR